MSLINKKNWPLKNNQFIQRHTPHLLYISGSLTCRTKIYFNIYSVCVCVCVVGGRFLQQHLLSTCPFGQVVAIGYLSEKLFRNKTVLQVIFKMYTHLLE